MSDLIEDEETIALVVKRESAAAELQRHVAEFAALRNAGLQELLAVVHDLSAAIVACERAELMRTEIAQILEPVYRANDAEERLARSCEAYGLSRAIAQQHRNRVQHQARRILETMIGQPGKTRIAALACGSCPDLRTLCDQLPALAGELWLSDRNDGAVQFSRAALSAIDDRCRFLRGDAVWAASQLRPDSFDLVLAGSACDSLDDAAAVLLLRRSYRLLAPGGVLLFTNITADNPYRSLIEYFGDWTLHERTEANVRTLCEAAGIGRRNVTMHRDDTGLALIVEIGKLE